MVIVGGGSAGVEKAKRLRETGAVVVVVDPTPSAAFDHVENVAIERCAFADEDVHGAWLVVTATDDPAVNDYVAAIAGRERVWINRADLPDGGPLALAAVLERGRVRVSVSTGGASPALAGWVRDQIDAALPAEVAELADILAARRRARARGHKQLSFEALLVALRDRDQERVAALLDPATA